MNMDEIQNHALQTYIDNIDYLQKTNTNLFNRVMMLSNAIEQNEYKERFNLEYIPEDKEFDIYDSTTQTFVYDRKPKKFIQEAVKNTNLDKLNSMDLLNQNIYNVQQPYLDDDTLSILYRTTLKCSNDIFDFVKIFKKSTLYKKKQFKYIEKFIFIGSLLGTHIPKIVDKLKLKFYLVYEYNLEIFRLSLFTTNYAELAKNGDILFSIMENKDNTELQITNFFKYAIRSNYMIKYYCTNYNIHDYFDRMLASISRNNPHAYNYWKYIDGLLKPSFENIKKYPVLDTLIHHKLLKDKPVLFLAAGPSFGKNIEWIKKYKNKYFIVAIGAVVQKLCIEGIEPNVITSCDGDEAIKKQFPDNIRDKISHIPFITATTTYTKVLDMFDKKNIITYEAMGSFKKNSKTFNANTIGEITLNIITALGANEIYMLGSDLALDQETGATHIDEHAHSTKHELTDDKKEINSFIKDRTFTLGSSTILVKGNFRDNVVTTMVMERAIYSYNKSIQVIHHRDKDVKIYNLNDGAFLEGTIPTKIEKILVPSNNIDLTKNYFLDYLTDNSEMGFTSAEKLTLKECINELDKMIDQINNIKNIKVKSYDDFVIQRREIMRIVYEDFKGFSVFYLDQIFSTYFATIEPYLGFQFNEKLKDEANYVKKVKKTWCEQMLKLSFEYKELINKVCD